MPVGYFHVVFTLPAEIADIAAQNKAVIYDLLFRAASQTMLTIAADRRHLGARLGITAVLHSWGSALTHHPHPHDRTRRQHLARRPALGLVPAGIPAAGALAGLAVPPAVPDPAPKLSRRIAMRAELPKITRLAHGRSRRQCRELIGLAQSLHPVATAPGVLDQNIDIAHTFATDNEEIGRLYTA